MAEPRQRSLQIRIGAFILAGLGVFLAIIYLLGAQARYFERKYDLVAEFGEVGGLIEGATVRLAGVQIGRVTDVALAGEPGGKVQVTLTIARRFADRIRARLRGAGSSPRACSATSSSRSRWAPRPPPRCRPAVTWSPGSPSRWADVFAEGADALAKMNRLATALTGTVERIGTGDTVEHISRLAAALGGAVDRLDRPARSTTSAPPSAPRGASPSRWRRGRAGSTRWSTRSRRRSGASTRS